MTTKTISIFNNKGGVGKTTLLWNIGDSLARKGKRVLMIDFDPQCNLSLAVLGVQQFTEILPTQNLPYGKSIRSFLQLFLQGLGGYQFYSHTGRHTHPNAELVAGDFWLNVYAEQLGVGSDLLTGVGIAKYVVLRQMVDFANAEQRKKDVPEYDFVLVDLPPSFGGLVRAALYSSDYFLVPCTSDTFSAYCVGLIGEMLPTFFKDWEDGFSRFKLSNPQFEHFDNLGKTKFAGWIFNSFDTRNTSYLRADQVHHNAIQKAIEDRLVAKLAGNISATMPPNFLAGDIEDMNTLAQNSVWQNVPVSQLAQHRPLVDIESRGNWRPNQIDQINRLRTKFENIADNILMSCT